MNATLGHLRILTSSITSRQTRKPYRDELIDAANFRQSIHSIHLLKLYKYPINQSVDIHNEKGVYTTHSTRLLKDIDYSSAKELACEQSKTRAGQESMVARLDYFFKVSVNRENMPPDEGVSLAGVGARGTSPRSGVSSRLPTPDSEWEMPSPVVGCSRAGAFCSRRDKSRSDAASSPTASEAAASAACASGSSSSGFSFFST